MVAVPWLLQQHRVFLTPILHLLPSFVKASRSLAVTHSCEEPPIEISPTTHATQRHIAHLANKKIGHLSNPKILHMADARGVSACYTLKSTG